MNIKFTKKTFFLICTLMFFLSTSKAFACVDNWTTVANGNWNDAIWSFNGGPAQTGPPPNNSCIFIYHTVVISGSFTLGSTGKLVIGINGNLIIKNDFTNGNIVENFGRLTVEKTIYNGPNSHFTNYITGVVDIYNDLINQACGSVITNHGIINIGNSFYNSGTVKGNGGMFNIKNDAINSNCCAVFAGNICVQDKDALIHNKCGIVESTVTQSLDCSPFLPIELLFFKGVAQNSSVLLHWSTASEINNDYFIVEKSSDNQNFFPVIKLKGAGNSNQILNYSAYDMEPALGYSYYRLKQVDYDEKYSYSEIIVVDYKDDSSQMDISYIPSSNLIKLTYNHNEIQEGIIEIYSMHGQKVFAEKLVLDKSYLQLTIKPETGIYIAKLITESNTVTKKLIIN